jgi:catechol 2,3-dioxygenase-like lactoylglutathione lyase family enzyme
MVMKAKLGAVQPVLMVRDVPASIRFFASLGFEAVFKDSPTDPKYAGVARDGVELHLQWHDASEWSYPNDRPTYRFPVDDVDRLFDEFRGVPNLHHTDVRDTEWGTREFHVHDLDKNGLQFYRHL